MKINSKFMLLYLFIFIIQDVNCILFYILILIADEKFSYFMHLNIYSGEFTNTWNWNVFAWKWIKVYNEFNIPTEFDLYCEINPFTRILEKINSFIMNILSKLRNYNVLR